MGKRRSGNSRPKSNSDRNARKAGFKENAGSHTLPGVVVRRR